MTSVPESVRELFAKSPEGLALHREGVLVHVNPAFAGILGADPDALEGVRIDAHMPETDRPGLAGWLEEKEPGSAHLRFLHETGRVLMLRLEPIRGLELEGERLEGFLARDVTHKRQVQTDLLVADRMMSIGALAAGVAHDINNPLSYVLGNLEFLAAELPDAVQGAQADLRTDLEEAIGEAQEGAQRVKRIVGDLRAFARVDPGVSRDLDVLRVVEAAVNMAFVEIRHRARLVKNLVEVPPVRANEARLGQIVLNLLLNSAHAMREGQQETNVIEIATRTEADDFVVIEVSDNGPGIPPEIVGRVFDPFFTTKPVGIGTGLGLAMVHGIATELGGSVDVESALGSGTRFIVRLPSVLGESAELGTADLEPAPTRVLVIDDDPLILSTIRRTLEREGHDVQTVDGGTAALALLERDAEFDVVFCDLLMPETSGMDVHAKCRERHSGLVERFAFMSGGVFTTRVHDFLGSVENPVVDKPFDMEQVARVARRIARGLRGAEVLGPRSY